MPGCISRAGAAFGVGVLLFSGVWVPPIWAVLALVVVLALVSEEDGSDE
jgi:cytochrome c biogenesis protein CcdA